MVVTACSGDAPGLGARRAAIVGADGEDTTAPYRYPAVVQVPGCTGTLVTPNHVLTAAHCVDERTPPSVSFVSRDSEATARSTIGVARCHMHPAYLFRSRDRIRAELLEGRWPDEAAAALGDRCGVLGPAGTSDRALASVDLAVLQLERPVPPSLTPASAAAGEVLVDPLGLVSAPPAAGSRFAGVAVGFGETHEGPGAPDGGVRRYRRVEVVMDPDVIGASVLGAGDSGGPLLYDTGSGLEVIGVASTERRWASLGRPESRAWVASVVDRVPDGRADTHCARSGRGVDPAASAATDADGDGYLDGSDTCPSTYNPCQEGTDLDGDGVDDDCDGCPADAAVAAVRGDPGVADADADGLPDACDCDPSVANPAADEDHDFVWTSCDNCRGEANAFQENADGDALGDACDRCPLHAGSGVDLDGDRVPYECDNCLGAPNPSQDNCNADAESVAAADPADPGGARILEPGVVGGRVGVGDACDPIPCGETAMGTRERAPPPDELRETAMDVVLVDGRRAVETAEPGYEAWTGLRFCRCMGARADSLADRRACRLPQPDGTGECLIPDVAGYGDSLEPSTWRWVTADYQPPRPGEPAPATRLTPPRTEVLAAYDPPGGALRPDARAHWGQEADLSRWTLAFGETIPFGPATPLPGVLWTHTPGDGAGPFDAATRDLASHYLAGGVDAPFSARAPDPCYAYVGPLVGRSPFCPACAASFPTPWLGTPGALGFLGCSPVPFEPPVLRLPGGARDAAPLFDRDPAELFGGVGGAWVAAAEPDDWLPEGGPRYAALAPEGTFAERVVVVLADGRLGTPAQPPPPPSDDPGAAATPAAAAARSDRGAAGASAWLAVLSARRALVWVLPRDGLGPLRAIDLRTGSSRELAPPDAFLLGRVLAATYAPALDSLLVLDEVGGGPGRRHRRSARLLRLDALGGGGEVLSRWPRVAPTRRFAMGTDPAGALWVAASGERAPAHVVVRLEVSAAGARPLGLRVGRGALRSEALRAGRRGGSLVVADERGREELAGHPTADLRPAGARDLERCF